LPRGRVRQDPYEAKGDSIKRIETALKDNPGGLKFKQLKQLTKLHQDTLSIRLESLVDAGRVKHPGKFYKLSTDGEDDLSRRYLVSKMTDSATGMVVVGETDNSSLFPDEDVILNSTVGYAFPAISPGVVGDLRRILHKYWMLHLITNLASQNKIDPRLLTRERPMEKLVDELKTSLTGGELVLAFIIDQAELKKRLNLEYVQEIIRLAKVEDASHLETKGSSFLEAFRGYAKERNKAH